MNGITRKSVRFSAEVIFSISIIIFAVTRNKYGVIIRKKIEQNEHFFTKRDVSQWNTALVGIILVLNETVISCLIFLQAECFYRLWIKEPRITGMERMDKIAKV